MKKLVVWGSATLIAVFLTFASVASAQEVTPQATTTTELAPVQSTQADTDDNDVPWGLLGLLGLAGLAGTRRHPEPVRREETRMSSGIGVYDKK